MKSTPPPSQFDRDLSSHPGDRPGDRLARVASGALVPGAGKPHGQATHVLAADLQEPTADDVERVTAMRIEAFEKLGPKKKRKGGNRG